MWGSFVEHSVVRVLRTQLLCNDWEDLIQQITNQEEYFACVTSVYQPTNAHIISNKTILKHFKTSRHVSILSDHHQGALFLAKVILQYSQFNSYLQMMCCGSISCSVGMCCGAVARCASYDAHLATASLAP